MDYNREAKNYVEAQRSFYSNKVDFARETLYRLVGDVNGKRLLDIGCGIGDDVAYFYQKGADAHGIDSAQAMVDLAHDYNPAIASRLTIGNLMQLPFDDESFDVVVSRYALHYADDLQHAIRETHRILQPGGLSVHIVAHPLIGFVLKDSSRYFNKEDVTIPLYGKISVTEPSRTFSEYINSDVLSMFELEAFEEGCCPEDGQHENEFKRDISDFLAIKLRKRT